MTAALGIACGLGAWVIIAATLALALFVLAGLAGIDEWLSGKAAAPRHKDDDASRQRRDAERS